MTVHPHGLGASTQALENLPLGVVKLDEHEVSTWVESLKPHIQQRPDPMSTTVAAAAPVLGSARARRRTEARSWRAAIYAMPRSGVKVEVLDSVMERSSTDDSMDER